MNTVTFSGHGRLLSAPRSYKEQLGQICRECLNKDYQVHLTPFDVVCRDEGKRCACCQMEKPLVVKVNLFGRLMMRFHP